VVFLAGRQWIDERRGGERESYFHVDSRVTSHEEEEEALGLY
jgi:hypothetical protein